MDKPSLIAELDALLKAEYCSIARHLGALRPHLTAATYPFWSQVLYLGEVSVAHSARLSALLGELGEGGHPQGFPVDIARYHYLDMTVILDAVMDEKRRQIESYRRAISHCQGAAHVVAELEALLADNEAHLRHMEEIHSQIRTGAAA